jgi:hypothetical protein
MSIHTYEYTHTYFIPMSTSKKFNRLDLEIYKVSHQERLTVDDDVVFH